MFSKITFVSVLAAVGLASAQIDPLTVTSLSPAQSSAIFQAGLSYGSKIATDPAFTSLVGALATDSAALGSFTKALGSLTGLPTGTAGLSRVNSLIDTLPSNQAVFFRSLISAEVSLASSVLNNGAVVTSGGSTVATVTRSATSATGSAASAASSAASSASSRASSATSAAANAAATPAYVKAAGLAVGAFGAAVAML